MANGNQIKFGVGYEVDKSSIQQVKQSLRDLQNIKIGDFKGAEEDLIEIRQTAKQVELALQNAFNAKLNTVNLDRFNALLKTSKTDLNEVYRVFSNAGAMGRNAFGQMTSQIISTNTQLTQTKTLLSAMGQTMVNTVKWGIASSVMNNFTNSVRQSVEYVKNLDSALTDIRIVTGDSTEKMKEFAVQANQAAQTLGRSTMDYSKAALTFYQQGLNDEEVQARTQATLKAQNITGAGEEMADYLTAVWNGYKVANEEAQLYVDKLAAVADSSASNMAQLATAMSKVASTANMLGVPVDKLNAQIATITATTRQAPETVGNALKTIYARINDIATGADDAQISLGNYSEKMAQVGFSVLDSNGKLRDTGDVIDQIGAKWSTLSRQQQIYLARTMAGQRQYNNLLALFENWGRYTDLVTVSMDSQGATMEKNERYLDSLAAKTEQYGAAQERVKSALINENDLKSIVDFGTNITNAFASLIETIGGGGKAFLALGSIVTSVFGNTIGKEIGSIINKHRELNNSIQAMQQSYRATRTIALQATEGMNDSKSSAYKEYINDMINMQKVWSAMSVEEIKAQQQRYNSIRSLKQQSNEIKQTTNNAQILIDTLNKNVHFDLDKQKLGSLRQELENVVKDADKVAIAIKNIRDDGSIENLNLEFQTVKQSLNDLIERTGIQPSENVLKILKQQGNELGGVLGETSYEMNILLSYVDQIKAAKLGVQNWTQYQQKIRDITNDINKLKYDAQQAQKNAQTIWTSQSIIKFASGVGSIASGISTIVNLTKVWNDENASLGEKILKTVTSVSFIIPMVLNGVKNISSALGVTAALRVADLQVQKKILETTIAISVAEKKITEEKGKQLTEDIAKIGTSGEKAAVSIVDKLKIGFGQAGKTILSSLSSIVSFLLNPVTLAVAAVGVTVGIVVKEAIKNYNKWKTAAEEANEEMKKTKDVFEESKIALDNLQSSLESLQEAEKKVNELTSGTEEWRQAIEDVNEQILDLIENYGSLTNKEIKITVGENGQFQLSEQDRQALLQAQQQVTNANNYNYLYSKKNADTINEKQAYVQLGRRIGVGSNLSGDDSIRVFSSLREAYKENSNILNYNTEKLSDQLKISEDLANKIINNKESIEKVILSIENAENATKSLQKAFVASGINSELFEKSSNPDLLAERVLAKRDQIIENYNYKDEVQPGGRYFKGSGLTEASHTDWNAILDDYASILNIDRSKLQTTNDGIFKQYNQQTKKFEALSNDTVYAVLAYQKAMEQVPKITEKEAAQIQAQIHRFDDKFKNQQQSNLAYQAGQGNLESGKYSISELQQLLNADNLKFISQQFGISMQNVADNIGKAIIETKNAIQDYLKTLPQDIQKDIKFLNKDNKISEQAQKAIGQSLKQAWDNGTYDQLFNIYKDLDPSDIVDFDSFFNSLNEQINSLDVSTFKDRLKELGISTKNLADGEIQALIDKLKEANSINLQEGMGTLYGGVTDFLEKYAKDSSASLSAKQFKEMQELAEGLGMDLEPFFKQMWDGSYQLKTSAEDFFNYVNNQSLDGFKKALEDAVSTTNQLASAGRGFGGLSFEDIQTYNKAGNNLTINSSLDFLEGIGETSKTIEKVKEDLNNLGYVTQGHLDQLNTLLEIHQDELQKLPEQYQKAVQEVEKLKQQSQQLTEQQEQMRLQWRQMQLDSDVKVEDWKNITSEIQNSAQASDQLADSLKTDNEEAENLSEEILRFASAAEQIEKNLEGWTQALSSGSLNEQLEAASQLRNVYADILDLPFGDLSSSFVTNAQNLQYLQTILYGDQAAAQAAYNQLSRLAEQDLEVQLGINDQALLSQFHTSLDEIRSTIDRGIAPLEIGAQIHDEAALEAMSNLINAAAMTADQAENLLASMGVDAQVVQAPITETQEQPYADISVKPNTIPMRIPNIAARLLGRQDLDSMVDIPVPEYSAQSKKVTSQGKKSAMGLKIVSAHKSSGGNVSFKRGPAHSTPGSGGSGGGGGGGGKGSTPKAPKIEKINTDKLDIKEKQPFINPYEEVEKSYERQEKELKRLDDLQKELDGKDRLKNLEQQNKALKKQADIIKKRQRISDDQATEGTTAYYKNKLRQDKAFKGVLKFDEDGQINQSELQAAADRKYNDKVNKVKSDFEDKQKEYNDWLQNVWNKYSGEQQQARKAEKQKRDEDFKNVKKQAEDRIKLLEDEHKKRLDLIDDYSKALEQDMKYHEQYVETVRQIIENQIQASKIKVDLSMDFGQLERRFLNFENKVVKRIGKDDILAKTKASAKEIQSYFNQFGSNEMGTLEEKIKELQREMTTVQAGGFSDIYGISREEFDQLTEQELKDLQAEQLKKIKEDLQNYTKQYMDRMQDIADLREEMYDNYLDSIDDVKDKMDQVIEQYERVNDLVEHNIKVTQLLFGDNAGFDILDKYYQKQSENNIQQMNRLREQEEYWRNLMNNAEVGSDDWKKFKANLENNVDSINAALENQLDLIATKFQNKIQQVIKNVTNKLTNGLGNDYLEREWDYISKDDDAFLDVVNSKFGIDQVERLYSDAIANTQAPTQQRKLNKLMDDQLKILREKDRLTQYDIDRAKAALEVEKARMALEDSRYQKTKMRLRRDSQGNYTYQYVADEQKLSDLQGALANAQAELYNMDKEHYKQQLNQMYSTYKEYLQDMADLEKQYEATTDEAEKKRIEAQMNLLRDKFSDYYDSISGDLQYTLRQYLTDSFGDAMNISMQAFTSEQQVKILKENLGYTNSQMQILSETIEKQGGILKATEEYYRNIKKAAQQAAAAQQEVLATAGTSIEELASGADTLSIDEVEQFSGYYETMASDAKTVVTEVKDLVQEIDKLLNISEGSPFVQMLQDSYNMIQSLNSLLGENGTITNVLGDNSDITNQVIENNSDISAWGRKFNNESNNYYSHFNSATAALESMGIDIEHLENITVNQAKEFMAKYGNALKTDLEKMSAANTNMEKINKEALSQNVNIEAHFPNVESYEEIKQAFDELQTKAYQESQSTDLRGAIYIS